MLDRFVTTLPPGARTAFEFRHASWHDPEVMARLREAGVALCVADSERMRTPVEVTARHAYFRLRDEGYGPEDLARWADTIRSRTGGCEDVFVYFKHENQGKGPEFAHLLASALTA